MSAIDAGVQTLRLSQLLFAARAAILSDLVEGAARAAIAEQLRAAALQSLEIECGAGSLVAFVVLHGLHAPGGVVLSQAVETAHV